jgi:cytochrome b6-f complex iron-sulfur subunit
MPKFDKTKEKQNAQSADSSSRRSFLTILWACLGIVAIIEFITVIISYLSPGKLRNKSSNSGVILEAGHVDSFPINSVTANIQGKFYLCRMEDGGFLALSSKCTHLGCSVPWIDKEKRFACPCHGSSYDIKGNVLSPPAPRPLDIYRVNIENDIVKVDISKRVKREKFVKEHIVYVKKGLK